MIEKYLRPNVFRKTIMEPLSQRIVGLTYPLKDIATKLLIGGNVVGAFRDTFEGLWQNIHRTLIKYQTDISVSSLAKAYAIVTKDSFTTARTINIVNQLCLKYRLSNIDVARISEGMKSERGVNNYENWLYATLRRPDFLNRMVLFVAKCIEDGTWDAFDIVDGELVYDWKKDKRFSVLASGDTNNPEYYKQKGLYYNVIRNYNRDHPSDTISMDDDLPLPYSFAEINHIKLTADSIYGSYDRSVRAMYEQMAPGVFLGMWTTWMNNILANYFAKPHTYDNSTYQVDQEYDYAGHKLFFDNTGNIIYEVVQEDGSKKYYYEGGNEEVIDNIDHMQPVMSKVPIVVQGIWYTLIESMKAIRNGEFKSVIRNNPMNRKNIYKLISDIIMWWFTAWLYSRIMDPAYKDFKKHMKERNLATNIAVEIVYKGAKRSNEQWKGPFNALSFINDDIGSSVYNTAPKLGMDVLRLAIGNKSLVQVLTGNISLFKSFQDSFKAAYKKQTQ